MEQLKHFILMLLVVTTADGSRLVLESSPTVVTPAVTTSMAVRCSVKAGFSSGDVIGRREVKGVSGSQADVTTELEFVTSMVMLRDGRDVASMTEHRPASSPDVTVQVEGQLTPGQQEQGYLQLSWPYPTKDKLGRYSCNVTGVDTRGHSFDFFQSINVDEAELTLDELANHIIKLKQDRDRMDAEITAIRAENALLKQKVFFSAAVSSDLHVAVGQVLVYDLVLSSKGGGYDNTTGVFTCPLPGIYTFQISGLSAPGKVMALRLVKNNQQVISIWSLIAPGKASGTSNSATIPLALGDTVKVIGYVDSDVTSRGIDTHTTFNGQLISLY